MASSFKQTKSVPPKSASSSPFLFAVTQSGILAWEHGQRPRPHAGSFQVFLSAHGMVVILLGKVCFVPELSGSLRRRRQTLYNGLETPRLVQARRQNCVSLGSPRWWQTPRSSSIVQCVVRGYPLIQQILV